MRNTIFGLSGLSGSGKTFYIDKLKSHFQDQIAVISFDDYYKPKHEQLVDDNGQINFDLPSGLYDETFLEHLLALSNNETIQHKKYQFQNYHLPEPPIEIIPAKIILAEGLFIYEFKKINELLSKRIFIETDLEISFQRRLHRDIQERGIPLEQSTYQWNNHVLPSYQSFVLPYKNDCDLIIQNNDAWEDNFEQLKSLIEKSV